MEYQVNQRVDTPLGKGTILGFEWMNNKGNGNMSDKDPGPNAPCQPGRIVVKLDDPSRWIFSEDGLYPHMYRHEVKPCD